MSQLFTTSTLQLIVVKVVHAHGAQKYSCKPSILISKRVLIEFRSGGMKQIIERNSSFGVRWRYVESRQRADLLARHLENQEVLIP
jgi:hypothetical protein